MFFLSFIVTDLICAPQHPERVSGVPDKIPAIVSILHSVSVFSLFTIVQVCSQ